MTYRSTEAIRRTDGEYGTTEDLTTYITYRSTTGREGDDENTRSDEDRQIENKMNN